MIFFLIPSYNDSQNFNMLLKNINTAIKFKKKIIIIDDGSTDKSRQLIRKLSKKYPVSIIGYRKNKGPGYAFKYGFKYLITKVHDNDIVITMEADNTADYKVVRKMLLKIQANDVVLASPYAKGGKFIGLSPTRSFLSTVANFLDGRIFRIKNVKTYSSFFRAYRGSILKKLYDVYKDRIITDYGFSSVVELLIKLNKIHAQITEIPAIIDWTNRQGKSKMKIAKTIVSHLDIYKNYLEGKYS